MTSQSKCSLKTWTCILSSIPDRLLVDAAMTNTSQILQRAIAEFRKEGTQTAPVVELPTEPKHRSAKSDGSISIPTTTEPLPGSNGASRAPTGSKRKYRRHPKVSRCQRLYVELQRRSMLTKMQPDDNAPDRPPSAYVLFSNRMYPPASWLLIIADKRCRSERAPQRQGSQLHRDCQDSW